MTRRATPRLSGMAVHLIQSGVDRQALPNVAQTSAIRRATHGNYALGTPRFADQIAALLGRRVVPGSPRLPRRDRAKAKMAH
ncbi:MAG: hypothetical protein FJX57_12130 [Alphaproteobacteria bacterium]|nr:hypothetical protein [Alphaproteobacteria bacterium]